jgi:hypothetical protein
LQSGSKGVISEIGVVDWRRVYVYILSMGRGCVRVINTYSFFRAANAASMDRNYRGSIPPTIRTQTAIGPISTTRSKDPRGSTLPHTRALSFVRTPEGVLTDASYVSGMVSRITRLLTHVHLILR